MQYPKSNVFGFDVYHIEPISLISFFFFRADLWAFGCVIYQMLSGKSPFKAATDYLIFQKIKNLEYTIPEDFPEVGKDIVERLLVSDPENRLGSTTTGGIQTIKDHAFFEGVDWENIFSSNAPPLRERLEKEAKSHPVIPPTFGFDEEEEEQDVWFGKNVSPPLISPPAVPHQNPFNDHAHIIREEIPQQIVFDAPTTTSSSTPTAQFSDSLIDRHTKSQISRHSSGLEQQHQHLKDDSMKRSSQLSSVASSTHSVPERSNGQAHPLW
jgi:3-phosphoinositide dependent protein kinase-1